MRIIGLTGGIACGKSTVSETLHSLGATVIDGDELSRRLTRPGGAALPAIRERFGAAVFRPDGTLDRRALGSVVFASDEKRAELDALMQPLLRRMIEDGIREAELAGAPVCVLDMPLLYEAGLDALCDRVWCVWAPEEIQLERLMARDGLNREEAEARIRSQLPAREKADRADVTIDTSGPIERTRAGLPALYEAEIRQGG